MAVILTNKLYKLTTSLADIYTYSGTRFARITAIQCANTNTTTGQTVQITISQSSTEYSIIKGLVIPSGTAVSVLTDPLTLKASDKIRGLISTGTTLNVDVFMSIEEYS